MQTKVIDKIVLSESAPSNKNVAWLKPSTEGGGLSLKVYKDQEWSKVETTSSSDGDGGSTPDTPTKPKYTGHADAEGLRAIGWTDEDIAYYQENGVNWNEEDDQYHLVSDDNKALYGVLTADNISTYKNRIVYLPKIDTSGVMNMNSMFSGCSSLVSIPQLDTSSVTNIANAFKNCYALVCIPPLILTKVMAAGNCFYNCYSLTHIADLDLSNAYNLQSFLYGCCSLVTFPKITFFANTSIRAVTFESLCGNCYSLAGFPSTENIAPNAIMTCFFNCYSLKKIGVIDLSNMGYADAVYQALQNCPSLESAYLKNVCTSININYSPLLSKDSLLYLINNEAATSAVTIKLHSYAYERLATDPDVVAALANHPNISISK